MRARIEGSFPRLRNTGFEVKSPATVDYNCIAWAAGDDGRWWWPDPYYLYYWPPEFPRQSSLEGFIRAFQAMGYAECETADLEPGVQKIAIYVDQMGRPSMQQDSSPMETGRAS